MSLHSAPICISLFSSLQTVIVITEIKCINFLCVTVVIYMLQQQHCNQVHTCNVCDQTVYFLLQQLERGFAIQV